MPVQSAVLPASKAIVLQGVYHSPLGDEARARAHAATRGWRLAMVTTWREGGGVGGVGSAEKETPVGPTFCETQGYIFVSRQESIFIKTGK